MTGLGLDYLSKITGNPANKSFSEMGESISYRLQSCQYLFYLLNKNQLIDETDLAKTLGKQPQAANVFELIGPSTNVVFAMAMIERPCLFDSLIYHLTSIFDYVGGLTELICGGQGRNRLKWNSLVNKCRNTSSSFCRAKVCPTVLDGNMKFVDRLYNHRSTIIHDIADVGGFEYTIHVASQKTSLNLYVTKRFINSFPTLKVRAGESTVTLRYAALFLMNEALDLLIEMSLKLREDIETNRRITRGMETHSWRNPDGTFSDASTPYWQ